MKIDLFLCKEVMEKNFFRVSLTICFRTLFSNITLIFHENVSFPWNP